MSVGLDSPKAAGYFNCGDVIRFSGWVLPSSSTDIIEWVVEDAGQVIARHIFSIKRNDVFKKYNISEDYLNNGFDFSLTAGSFSIVSISINSVSLPIWRLDPVKNKIKASPSLLAIKFKDYHNRNRQIPLVDIDNNIESNLSFSDTDFDIIDSQVFINRLMSGGFQAETAKSTIAALKDADWPITFILSGISGNKKFLLPGFYSAQPTNLLFSQIIDDYNFLFFTNESECFYLIQFCTNTCLVFPGLMLVVSLTDVEPWVTSSVERISKLFYCLHAHNSVLPSHDEGNFLGLCLAQARPYHFIYDYLYGLNILFSLVNTKFDVYGICGYDFVDVGFYENCASYQSVSNIKINELCLRSNGFIIAPCVQYIHSEYDRGLEQLRHKLIGISRSAAPIARHHGAIYNTSIYVWIGISTEKRSWLEQIDGFAQILNKLYEHFAIVHCFVDGRTFPLTPTSYDLSRKSKEDGFFNTLVEKCPKVIFVNLIGMTPVEKIACAINIDFFITSYGTDSIYPSAICGKPGVVYVASSIGVQRSMHLHRNIIEIPSEKINEVATKSNSLSSWHETSVSMDWNDVYEQVLYLLAKDQLV